MNYDFMAKRGQTNKTRIQQRRQRRQESSLEQNDGQPLFIFHKFELTRREHRKGLLFEKTYKLEWVRSRYNVNIRESCSRYKQKCHWNVFLNLRDQSQQTASFEKKSSKEAFSEKSEIFLEGKSKIWIGSSKDWFSSTSTSEEDSYRRCFDKKRGATVRSLKFREREKLALLLSHSPSLTLSHTPSLSELSSTHRTRRLITFCVHPSSGDSCHNPEMKPPPKNRFRCATAACTQQSRERYRCAPA